MATLMQNSSLSPQAFEELDATLDDLRSRYDETPQWEFCEGFMAALICRHQSIPTSECLPVLLAIGLDGETDEGSFSDAAQQLRFVELWTRRWHEVRRALDAPVDSLDDTAAYQPEVMDVRGAVAALPEDERAAMAAHALPAFAQVWALGFMFAVEAWPDEWAAPQDQALATQLDHALQSVVALTEDDNEPASLSIFDVAGPPSLSVSRLNAFADALWAVYALRRLWRSEIG